MTPAPASDAATAHYASYGTQEAQYGDFTTYGGYDTNGFATAGHGTATFDADPLFGSLPGDSTGVHDAQQWATGSHQTLNYDDAYAAQHYAAYDTGAYDTTAWSAGHQPLSAIPPQATGPDVSGQWDANAWLQPDQSGVPADGTQQWEWGTQAFDTGAYDATQWNAGSHEGDDTAAPADDYEQQAEQGSYDQPTPDGGQLDATGELPSVAPVAPLLDDQEEVTPAPASRAASRSGSRSAAVRPPSAPRC